ncbi:META domain-containing protein [Streptomyces liangshanensis]|uniref:META domain-containing protein n=1 Tax=Streptomyces liangshanensis TaxID=2717324 RepID=A0A6G9H0B9_9ACTN|nr:META domain-containing protein [Streptomyces liangshanensis]QIQ03983.1 META domain-containing protein [Streptomyces liangshanensis]
MIRPTRMQKQQSITVTAVTALALFGLAACGSETTSTTGAGGDDASVRESALAGVRWHLESVTVDGRRTAGVAGTSLEFGDSTRATLATGCDEYAVDVSVAGDTVTVGGKRATATASCTMNLDALDKALDEAFTGKLTAKVAGDRLTLTSSDGDVLALTSGSPAPLTGTKWTVNALASDGSAARLPAGTDGSATFTLGADGSVRGNLGCNGFSARAKVAGDTITFSRVISTKMACSGPRSAVERHLAKVLRGTVTYDLNHGGLWLTGEDGGLAALPAPKG